MDDADSDPTIKLQSAKRYLNFTVLIDKCKVVVIHIPEEIFIHYFCEITYTNGRDAFEGQIKIST